MSSHEPRATATRVRAAVSTVLPPLLPVLGALAVWQPLRHNYFTSDDFDHLFAVATHRLPWLLVQFWGGHLLTAYNAIYSALFHVFGSDPRGYFWTVLVTHVVNTGLLYAVMRRLGGDRVLACAGATAWGMCPVLEGALGWFSVYGQVVLATLMLAVLASLGRLIDTGAVLSPRRAAAWAVALAVGSTCFGMGLGLAIVLPLAVLLALPRTQLPWRSVAILVLGAAATAAGYELARLYSPGVGPYDLTIFSVDSMVRTSPAAVVMLGHLLAFGTTAFAVGFLGLDQGYPDAVAVAATGAATAVLLAALWLADPATRRRLLAVAVLALAAYASIAAGRTNLMVIANSSLAWAGSRPRYHYLPLALLATLLTMALASLAARGRTARLSIESGAALWVASRIAFLVLRPFPIQHWPEARAESEAFVAWVHDAAAAARSGDAVVLENRPFPPKSGTPDALLGGSVGAFTIFFPDDVVDGRRIRFAVSDHHYELAQREGPRVSALVVRSASTP